MNVASPTTDPTGGPAPAGDGPSPSKARLGFLDGLRGLAAGAVLVHHSGVFLSPAFGDFVVTKCDLGNLGVIVFFLCSGFIIPVSLENHGSLRRFWVQRVCRLYPLYWFSIAATLLSYVAISRGVGGPHAVKVAAEFMQRAAADLDARPWQTVAANLTMLQLFLSSRNLVQLYWTLSYEMVFYFIVSGLFVLGLHKRTVALTVVLLASSLAVEAVLPLAFGVRVPGRLFSYLATMFLGTVVFRLYQGGVRPRTAVLVFALAVPVLALAAVGDVARTGRYWSSLPLITARLGALAAFAVAFLAPPWRAPPPLLYLGKISYSTYLMHVFVVGSIPPLGGQALTVAVWFAGTLVVASATYFWIERPGMALGRRLAEWGGGAGPREAPARGDRAGLAAGATAPVPAPAARGGGSGGRGDRPATTVGR